MLNIVLYEPEIPQNVGNISRTCVGMNCVLHLIKPYGFIIDDKKLRRAGINYWNYLKLFEYNSFEEFLKKNNLDKNGNDNNIFIITRHGRKTLKNINFKLENVYIIFGKESSGLPEKIMRKYINNSIRIPTINVRSLNLSNCVAIISHNYSMQNDYKGLDIEETIKKIY